MAREVNRAVLGDPLGSWAEFPISLWCERPLWCVCGLRFHLHTILMLSPFIPADEPMWTAHLWVRYAASLASCLPFSTYPRPSENRTNYPRVLREINLTLLGGAQVYQEKLIDNVYSSWFSPEQLFVSQGSGFRYLAIYEDAWLSLI